ncbi:NucA/NucB deoxyribonuclease domain-containing protein [Anaerosinus massiliensis]|uniref:NucA/NucB deoxyribonuclease domain-containing protein n=1 Tax=Massilibacillus massiliensis TaxID=1806837 RepID=UPI000AC6918B|nr:NucA/NucB deoxyribonuclease domain-containing protein [Massilibacillus massiliensis]
MTAEDWAEIGLAVAGFIPSPGATAAVAVGETALAVHQGDYVGAGVSVLSGIPVVGGFVRVAKVMKKGKIARKILHLINKGKNLAKRAFKKIAKKAKQLGGKMKTLSSHMMADARKAIENAAKKIAGKTGKGKAKVEVKISKSKYPESAQHIEDAIKNGHPDTLTIKRSGAAANRKESLKGVETVKGKDRDEYPPAMFEEGGKGASVRTISSSDNRGAGSTMGQQLRSYPDGTKVKIKVEE